jgi:hypothetical protein
VEVGALLPPEQLAGILNNVVLPSLEMLAQWEESGTVRGGILAGQRAGAYLMEAASAEEVGERLASVPFWGMLKWRVTPLQSTRSAIARERGVAERLGAPAGR